MNVFLLFLLSIAIFLIILSISYVLKYFRSQRSAVIIDQALKKNDYMKALKLSLEQAKEKRSFAVYNDIAQAYEGLSDIPQAIHYYEDALALFSSEVKKSVKINTLIKIGNMYSKRNDILKASGNYLMALEENPDDEKALFELANINYRARNFQKAVFYLDKLIKVNPGDWKAYYLLGNTHNKMGSNRKAIMAFENALKLKIPDVQDKYNIAILLSDAYTIAKSHRESINLLKPLLNQADYFEEAFLRIMKNLVSDNQMVKAIEMGLTYIGKLTPRYKYQALYLLGSAYFDQGEYFMAIDSWSKAYQINPDYADLRDLMHKYKVMVDNKFLEYYYSKDEKVFDEFILGNLQFRPVQPVSSTRAYKIFKGSNNRCLIFYRQPFIMNLSDLKSMENAMRQEYLGNFSFSLYTLFGTTTECKGYNFYKKIQEICGDQFVLFFYKNSKKKAR